MTIFRGGGGGGVLTNTAFASLTVEIIAKSATAPGIHSRRFIRTFHYGRCKLPRRDVGAGVTMPLANLRSASTASQVAPPCATPAPARSALDSAPRSSP
jgi:hypothetical protein